MLGAFLSHPFVETLDVDDEASHLYARLTSELRALGRPIPTNDAWIAALSLREGAEVLTYDEHFRTLPGVKAKILSVVQ
jgi:predicted nucleic acid-binding protein